MKLKLIVQKGGYAVCRLDKKEPVPSWVAGEFISVTRTKDELSIVCNELTVPKTINKNSGWKLFKIEGPLKFSLAGVISSLAVPLAEKGISIFVISTYETDYFLLKEDLASDAIKILSAAGHTIIDEKLF